jgi:hypothetical protein
MSLKKTNLERLAQIPKSEKAKMMFLMNKREKLRPKPTKESLPERMKKLEE